ncbi:hypothetical protein GUJ93_ZPchr0260g46477 [Zizania palustris]|uniref:Uncharacterized protein n=1 Tax=Zizania palustris TaxID=103762 RepID=A0A8J5RMS9_ZIZPA|nr:hypothetical protein GUJ93_ZPchr0260g46477 [Zizania palustris]
MKLSRDHGTVHDKGCSFDGFYGSTKHQGSVMQMSATFSEDPAREENEKIITMNLLPIGENDFEQCDEERITFKKIDSEQHRKLLHGSERRNAQHSGQATPVKIASSTNYDDPSPITTDLRSRRKTITNRSSASTNDHVTQIISRREVRF